ncbi:unnamed protein product [Arabidopsis halleri]
MMNRKYSCFLLVIALCLGLSAAVGFNEKNSVHITNSLGPNNDLKVCCVSDEDDLGCPLLSPGQSRVYSFHDSILKTKIDCNLVKGSTFLYHSSFRAYEGGGFISHYGKEVFWDAREDGVYLSHGKDTPKFMYKWI